MNLNKLINHFMNDYILRAPYANKEELEMFINEMKDLIEKNKDKTPEEIIKIMLEDNIREIDNIREKYGIPGYTIGMNVGNIRIKLYGGTLSSLGEEMTGDALFDIASMTKFYTQVICYHLMHDEYFSITSEIRDLDNRFMTLGDLTVGDILSFGTTFQTSGRIANAKNIDEAKKLLYNAMVIEKGKYNYNDIGMMIMKEVMEDVTGLSYSELLEKYILRPLNLSNTHLIVPHHKLHLVTGTPNYRIGHVNDPAANVLGGYSGHAGIFAGSDDINKFLMSVHSTVPGIKDAYTRGVSSAVGKMGNVYIYHPEGLTRSFVDTIEGNDSIAIQGSTRVNATGTHDSAHNILFNPSSMGMEEAQRRVAIINEMREKEGRAPINPLREFDVTQDGKLNKYQLIDPRQLVPLTEIERVIKRNALTIFKLRFFNEVIEEYSRNKEMIDVTINTNHI